MIGQSLYLVVVVTLVDILNVLLIHSTNLEQVVAAGLLAVVIWVCVGTFLVYYA